MSDVTVDTAVPGPVKTGWFTPFNIITGIMITMTRVMNSMVLVTSRLASSKRSSSCSCRLKARTTSMPARLSRTTRLSRSVSRWMALNLGTARK